jgi:3-oxoacyl-[acyl-carrier-protein] synthase-3
MLRSKIAGIGYYVPERIVKNDELTKIMDTTDEWIQERTGIQERRYGRKARGNHFYDGRQKRLPASPANAPALRPKTLISSYLPPSAPTTISRLRRAGAARTGHHPQREVGALDIRNQCSGFMYALSIADQFVKTGMYKNVLVVGSEMHSMGLDFSTRGRNVTVIFGDGAGAAILQPTDDPESGHSDHQIAFRRYLCRKTGVYQPRCAWRLPCQ